MWRRESRKSLPTSLLFVTTAGLVLFACAVRIGDAVDAGRMPRVAGTVAAVTLALLTGAVAWTVLGAGLLFDG